MVATVPDHRSDQSTLVNSARGANGRGDVLIPHYDGGRLRVFHMKYTAPASGNPAAGEVISMGFLPQGLIIPHLTALNSTDFGGVGTVDIGLNEYKKNDGTTVTADPDEFWNDLDVSGQDVNTTLTATGVAAVTDGGFQVEGFAEVLVTLASGGMQAAATLDLFFVMATGQ